MDLNAANVTLNMHSIAAPPHSSCLRSDVQFGDPKSNTTVAHRGESLQLGGEKGPWSRVRCWSHRSSGDVADGDIIHQNCVVFHFLRGTRRQVNCTDSWGFFPPLKTPWEIFTSVRLAPQKEVNAFHKHAHRQGYCAHFWVIKTLESWCGWLSRSLLPFVLDFSAEGPDLSVLGQCILCSTL